MHYLNRQKAIQRRKRLLAIYRATGWNLKEDDQYARILLKTRKPCSCFVCNRTRKRDGETVQERRSIKLLDFEGEP